MVCKSFNYGITFYQLTSKQLPDAILQLLQSSTYSSFQDRCHKYIVVIDYLNILERQVCRNDNGRENAGVAQ